MTILVSLNPHAKPPVTVSPTVYDLTIMGASQITWAPAAGQNFAFVSLTFQPSASRVLGPPQINAASISVNANNTNNGPAVDYPYTLVVSQNGATYSTGTPGPAGTGGAPTIRNH
jgi:hypothetical protein